MAEEEAGPPDVGDVPHRVHGALGGLAEPDGAVEEQEGADDERPLRFLPGCGSAIAAGCR